MEVTFENNTLFVTDNSGTSAKFTLTTQEEKNKMVQILIRFFELANNAKLAITDEDIEKKTCFCSGYCKAGQQTLDISFFADQSCILEIVDKERNSKTTMYITFDEFCIILTTILKNKNKWEII